MRYCLIGERLLHSYSADLHRAQGLDYTLKEVPRGGLKEFLKEGYDGFNITIPYKKEIIPLLDGVDKAAEKIGAVNTVVKKGGKYYGYNTDLEGMRYALSRKNISLTGKRVMILGSGGAAITAKALCVDEKAADIITVSRTGGVNYENCYEFRDTEIIINATPVGTFPNFCDSPVSLSRFPALKGVFDCVYNPFNTALIAEAKRIKINCSDGLAMLVKQALLAEEIWGAGKSADAEEIIDSLYLNKLNLVLCGMPGSGKSTVGRRLADILGRKFIDADAEIFKETGLSPAEIIERRGEKTFRDAETEVIKKLALSHGTVIATGGGAVTREENIRYLKANGVICYIKRDISLLSSVGRPLSAIEGIEKLYRERKSLYESAADFTAENSGKIDACAGTVARKFKALKFNPEIQGEKI